RKWSRTIPNNIRLDVRQQSKSPMKTLTAMALAMLAANVNAAWEYNDVPDKMGEHGVEHPAWINSVENGQARLVLSYSDGDISILLKTTGVINGDSETSKLWTGLVDVRFDDGPIWRYEIHGLSDNY